MRILAIVGALLLGLIGLLMSLCGGGFLLAGLLNSAQAPGSRTLNLLFVTAPFIVVGGLCIWGCAVILKRKTRESGQR